MSTKKPKYQGVPGNFGGLPEECSTYETSRVIVLPVPYDSTTSYRSGTRHGPQAIIEASQNVELFDEELHHDFSGLGICTLEPMVTRKDDPGKVVGELEQIASQVLEGDRFLLTLGGEHSISSGLVAAYQRKFSDLTVLQIDAHLDLRDTYEGTAYNHACVMRRVIELCPRVAVGIRSFSEGEWPLAQSMAESTFYMSRIRRESDWIEQVCRQLRSPVYLTVDLDGFDPAVCPGVGTPEPGGLSWFDMMDLLEALTQQHTIVGADVVELIPDTSGVVSAFMAARLCYKIMCYAHLKTRTEH
ncbi:agmatinase [bacterium]|nr:agmatinase [bacterium]